MQQGVDIAWVSEREDALGAIVRDRKPQERGGDGVGFDEVEAGKARDEIVVVVAILVLVLIPKSSTTKTKEIDRET